MKMLLMLFVTVCLCATAFAQPNSEFFAQVQNLVNKAKGQKFKNLSYDDIKITDQIFTADQVSVATIGVKKNSTERVSDYTNIKWVSGVSDYLMPENSNDKLTILRLRFKSDADWEYHAKGITGTKMKVNDVDLYFLTKDYEAMQLIFKEHLK